MFYDVMECWWSVFMFQPKPPDTSSEFDFTIVSSEKSYGSEVLLRTTSDFSHNIFYKIRWYIIKCQWCLN